jgi:hypothetical protein
MTKTAFVVARCARTRCGFAIGFERRPDSSWLATRVIPLKEQATSREGYGTTEVTGTMSISAAYPGCPACESKSFFECGRCNRVNCWDGASKAVNCAWCGNSGAIEGSIKNLKGALDV